MASFFIRWHYMYGSLLGGAHGWIALYLTVRTGVCARVRVRVCMFVHMYMYVCLYTCIYARVVVCTS